MSTIQRRDVGRVLVAASLVVIAGLTLYPDPGAATADWRCIFCGTRGAADMILNVFLFAPLGSGLALAGVRHRNAFAIAAVVSAAVELAQTAIPGRDASIGDLLANSAGSGLGFGLVVLARYWLTPAENLARWLVLSAALAVAACAALTGVMLQPAFTDSTYYGQWTPRLRHLDPYGGSVLEATIGTLPMPSTRLDSTVAIARLLRRGSPIRVRTVAGPPTTRLSALFSIADAERNRLVLLGLRGRDLYYRLRMRAESFRLDRPTVIVRDVMASAVGDTVVIAVWREGSGYCVAVGGDDECDLGFTPGSGWTLLQFVESAPSWLQQLANAVWMCLLLVPLGYWMRPNVHSLFGGCIVVAALLLVPAATGLLAMPVFEWAGAVAGVGLGLAVRAGMDRGRHHYRLRTTA
ncbi:MAG: VanZ family protein [Gemmatimonadota bacterium]|nr:MAG: VanZ family protein [Gemmatimonadota bacterium]